MSKELFWAIVGLIWLIVATAMWRASEAEKRRAKVARLAQVKAATTPTLRAVPDRGWRGNNEGGHHPEARETADGRYRPGCTCRWDCLRLDPSADIPWPTAGEATAEADRLLRARGSR